MLVEPIVAAGLRPDDLRQLTEGVAAAALSDFITWLAGDHRRAESWPGTSAPLRDGSPSWSAR